MTSPAFEAPTDSKPAPAEKSGGAEKNTPTPAEIEGVLRAATGDPSSGAIAEWIPAMAQAVADWLTMRA